MGGRSLSRKSVSNSVKQSAAVLHFCLTKPWQLQRQGSKVCWRRTRLRSTRGGPPSRENARGGAAAVFWGAPALALGGGSGLLTAASCVVHSLECRGAAPHSSRE